MKPKKNYRRKQGHRQPYTKVEITSIKTAASKTTKTAETASTEKKAAEKKTTAAKKTTTAKKEKVEA